MILETLNQAVEVCARKHIANFVLSPGSRVAPLTLALVRHPDIQTRTISDERSAAFVALGIANQFKQLFYHHQESTWQGVGIACTSGSAAYAYAPAVAEAFYQQIPLIVLTADRPPEWINQKDGQTIQQNNIYGAHVKAAYEMPVDTSHSDAHWHAIRLFNDAINLAFSYPYGPVHINVPIREPFYPQPDEKITFHQSVKVIKRTPAHTTLSKNIWNELLDRWEHYENKLILAGQYPVDTDLIENLNHLYHDYKVPIVGDVIANLSACPQLISHQDIFLPRLDDFEKSRLRPQLLITYGHSVLSKSLKLYLRAYPPHEHWHIQEAGAVADTFQSLTRIIPVEPAYFFRQLYSDLDFMNMLESDEEGEDNDFNRAWQNLNLEVRKYLLSYDFSPEPFSEMQVVGEFIQALPDPCTLHLANSMPVRYVNFWSLHDQHPALRPSHQKIEVFANRGTSGIDGSLSTAVGAALANPDQLVVLLIGDMAFFYDRNGLWHNYLPPNLRIVLLNNQGGNIFRMIAGPAHQPELEEYFETFQKLSAQHTARDFGLDYMEARDLKTIRKNLKDFFQPDSQAKLLEIHTNKQDNATVLQKIKRGFRA